MALVSIDQPSIQSSSRLQYSPRQCFFPCRNTDHGAADVRPALHGTLKDLQLQYLDLYLVRP